MINFDRKYILNIGAIAFLTLFSANTYAEYYNAKDSGVFVNGSIGASQSVSTISGSYNAWPFYAGYDYDFPTQNSMAGSLSVGYKISFGEKEKWNQFYTGGSFNYYNFGRVVDPVNSSVTYHASTNEVTVNSTEYTTLNALGFEAFIGKYLASAFSVELGLGIGGSVGGSSSQGTMGTFKLRAGYDIIPKLTVFVEYLSAGFTKSNWTPFIFFYGNYNHTGIGISTEQVGLEYSF